MPYLRSSEMPTILTLTLAVGSSTSADSSVDLFRNTPQTRFLVSATGKVSKQACSIQPAAQGRILPKLLSSLKASAVDLDHRISIQTLTSSGADSQQPRRSMREGMRKMQVVQRAGAWSTYEDCRPTAVSPGRRSWWEAHHKHL